MIDYKILFIIVPLVIIIVFAYREISVLKQNINDLNSELKQQTSHISENVNQCIDRIEKISKLHISELQNINKINVQKINKINTIKQLTHDTDNFSECLSGNAMSPLESERDDKKCGFTENVSQHDDTNEPFVSNDDVKQKLENILDDPNIPVFDPEIHLQNNDDSEFSDDSNISENILDEFEVNVELKQNITHPKIELINDERKEISVPINLPDPDNVSTKSAKSSKSAESTKSDKSAKSTESGKSTKSDKSTKSKESLKSNKSEKSNKSKESTKSSKSEEHTDIDKSKKTRNETLKDMSEYTLIELKEIAKKRNISITFKSEGKTKQYKKSELYDLINKTN